jgi:hypothetical protein
MQSILSNFLPLASGIASAPRVENNDQPLRAITPPKPQNLHFFPRMHPQDAISLFGALWGGVAENIGPSRLLPLRAISRYGALWLFPENY